MRAQPTPIARRVATTRSGLLREATSSTPAREKAAMVWPLGKEAATWARREGPSQSSGRARATAYLMAWAMMPAERPPRAMATAYSTQRRGAETTPATRKKRTIMAGVIPPPAGGEEGEWGFGMSAVLAPPDPGPH